MRVTEVCLVKHIKPVDDGKLGLFGTDSYGGTIKGKRVELADRWRHMIKRCYDSTSKDFRAYGARGTTVCKRWQSFKFFKEDISNLPNYTPSMHLDKDIYGSNQYGPTTCILVPKAVNSLLNGIPIIVSWDGAEGHREEYFMSIQEANAELKLPLGTILRRFNNPFPSQVGRKESWENEVFNFSVNKASVEGHTMLPKLVADSLCLKYLPYR